MPATHHVETSGDRPRGKIDPNGAGRAPRRAIDSPVRDAGMMVVWVEAIAEVATASSTIQSRPASVQRGERGRDEQHRHEGDEQDAGSVHTDQRDDRPDHRGQRVGGRGRGQADDEGVAEADRVGAQGGRGLRSRGHGPRRYGRHLPNRCRPLVRHRDGPVPGPAGPLQGPAAGVRVAGAGGPPTKGGEDGVLRQRTRRAPA